MNKILCIFLFIIIFYNYLIFTKKKININKNIELNLEENINNNCLVNSACTGCQKYDCNTCQTCQSDACRACKINQKIGTYSGCYVCQSCKYKEIYFFKRNCNCHVKQAPCKFSPYCDSCKKPCVIYCNRPRSIFIPRSQGANTARELVGWQDFIYAYRPGINFLTTAHTIEYTQSLRDYTIAQYLFGRCNLYFSGSQVKNRANCQIIADYFGLSPKFKGVLQINPIIENVIWENQFFLGLNKILCGLYVRANVPFVYTRWDLQMKQKIFNTDCPEFPTCYMAKLPVKATCNIIEALSGNFLFGQMQEKWKFGKFSDKALTKIGVADVDIIIGYNNHMDELSHFGFYLEAVMPTGNKPNSRYIFEPIVGNSKHFELGAGLTCHMTLWTKNADQKLLGYLQGNITHMFKNTQLRSFDFCKNGPLSRYLLLKEYKIINNKLVYSGHLINAINYTTRPADVSISIKGDFSALLSYRSEYLNLDLGYNFYGQTKENVKLTNCELAIDKKLFGIKGTSDVCSLEYSKLDILPIQFDQEMQKITNNSTQNKATICTVGKINSAQNIIPDKNNIIISSFSKKAGFIESNNVILAKDSAMPKLVSKKDLDIDSGTAGAIATNKIFGYIDLIFKKKNCFNIYIGLGTEVEIEGLACNEQTSLNQWGIWMKGGIDF